MTEKHIKPIKPEQEESKREKSKARKPKKLPYGVSNYRDIALNDYLYVDKTKYIAHLDELNSPYLFFLRPGRFGKSLFTSMLNCYYDVKEKDNFDAYFSGTYIGQNPTEERNRYMMLNFDFSGMNTDTPAGMLKSFGNITGRSIELFTKRYRIDYDCREDDMPGDMLDGLLSVVDAEAQSRVYVVIDEYDHFANELLSFRLDLFKTSVSKTGFVRKWYETLKKHTKTSIKRIFATGVSPIALDSLTSGFNIAADITREAEFNEMMGFTEAEVRDIIRSATEYPLDESKTNALMQTLTGYYNGYLFSRNADTRLFNSNMILYFLNSYLKTGKLPEELIDTNLTGDYSKLSGLFELSGTDRSRKVIETIISGESVPAAITGQFSMERDFTGDDLKSMLFYLGLLTIDAVDYDLVHLKVPNAVMKGLYFTYFIKMLEDRAKYSIDTGDIQVAVKEIAAKGSNEKFIDLAEGFLHALANRNYRGFDEKHIQLIMLGFLSLSRLYNVKSEYEVPGGFVDIALLPNNRFSVDCYALLEVKHVKKSLYEKDGDKAVQEKRDEAVAQLNRYASAPEFTGLAKLKKWALVFVGDKCVVNEEVRNTDEHLNFP